MRHTTVIFIISLFFLACQKDSAYQLPYDVEDYVSVNCKYGKSVPRSLFVCRLPRFHNGLSLVLKKDAKIYTMNDGVVTALCDTCRRGFGKRIEIQHNDSILIRYYHLSEMNVEIGDIVTKGQQIAVSGHSGTTTVTGLGIRVYLYDCAINPEEIILFPKSQRDSLNLIRR